MGAEREDTDPHPSKGGTEPGLGNPSAGSGRAAAASSAAEGGPVAVDFDALHAALGDPLDLDDLSPDANLVAALDADQLAESSGRSSATYSSSRPHTIPPSYAPVEDLNAPPVIVASDDTIPSAPPQMTVPVGHPRPSGRPVPFVVGPAAGHPSSGPHPTAPPGRPLPPEAQAFLGARGPSHMTMRMPDRPLNPRRARTPTLIVRQRGPSAKQKLVAFMAMLLLVTACGIAVIIWRKPRWLGLDPSVPFATTTSVPAVSLAPSDPSGASPVPVVAVPLSGHAAASAAPTASIRILRPRAAPTVAPAPLPPPHPSAGR